MKNNKILAPDYLFITIILIGVLHYIVPFMTFIFYPWNLIGIIPFLLGFVLDFIADRAFKENDTTVRPFEESKVLITNSVFEISRNPMYLGFILILFGIALILGSLISFLIVIAFVLLIHVKFIKIEERMLEEKFGESWHIYKKRVGRWI